MHLLFLQLLVLLPLGKAAWPQDGGQSQGSVPPVLLLERNPRELPLGNHGEAEEKPDLFVALPHLVGASISGEGQWQREKMLSRFGRFWKKPERELHPTQDPISEHSPPGTQALPQPKDRMQIKKSPLQEEAKKFWHRFMFRMSPASQGVILPIKSHEVHQETCRTLPFSQTITHEDCEQVVVQNNLCFGKCGSTRFPEAAQHPHASCYHCAPTRFTRMHLPLNCSGLAPVVKVVMLVEECQCKVKEEHHEHGYLLQAASQADLHAPEPFIPEFST
ncbi:cerberus [Pipistrellus kuhlii]|uniref:Cerberus n=1 Tax=Pipistrellus kuhlii TaxID=59472 RepID=A0A7J7W2X0_PIPKU|nr:cerberus [Pipistrellus kuhlii]KAF6331580.1 cerberus 1, DAN family BMP antagonist [Pipistrellus kuhlii]